ncbi:Ger(x)C family spore germination protein [Paenibacillus sp. YAF4_2]|uniref:Ger(x)C family spore germination protein n=1 Tax=Paenibacillus sp. YAF4_2 TaxID=3233085 RepID=UPI003F96667A
MRRRLILTVCIGFLLTILTGCWDVQYLTNKKMINGISIDTTKDKQIMGTVRAVILENKGGGQFDVKDNVVQAVGDSVYNVGLKIDSMLPGTAEASKTHIVIIGEDLAKLGILSPLEIFYRDPKGYLKSNILISKGTAADILTFKKIENTPIAFGIKQILDGSRLLTVVPELSLYSLWSRITDPGEDVVLPMIHKVGDKALMVNNIALFDGDRYSGVSLSTEYSKLLLLLKGKLARHAFLVIPTKEGVITFEVRKLKRSVIVSVDKKTSEIDCSIKVHLYGAIVSNPDGLSSEVDREQMNKDIAERVNKEAASVVDLLLQANCDALGIGRNLRAHHPKLWKNITWKSEYKDVKIRPEFQIHVTNTGIIS